MSSLTNSNLARVRRFNEGRAARVAAAVVTLAAKWGAALAGSGGGIDPAQVVADQVAQVQRVHQAAQS